MTWLTIAAVTLEESNLETTRLRRTGVCIVETSKNLFRTFCFSSPGRKVGDLDSDVGSKEAPRGDMLA